MEQKTEIRTRAKNPTDALFGRSPDSKVVHYPISIAPHFIVAGTTGSGKSVFINQIAVSMMTHALPSELKLAIIDPKVVEFANYKGLPYMLCDPVTDMSEANDLVTYLTILMDERYVLMAEAGVKNIDEYNEWAEKNNQEKFTYIVAIVDEFADLIGQFKEVEAPIQRLGQKARASGIHVIIATQTPRADIITGKIKANFPSRVALMVASSTESLIVLDEGGAEKLRPRGDMYIKMNGGQLERCQGGFISNEELDSIFTHLKKTYGECVPIDFKSVVAEHKSSQPSKVTSSGVGMGIGSKPPVDLDKKASGFGKKDTGMARREVQTDLPPKSSGVSVSKDRMEEIERRRREKREAIANKEGQKLIAERKERNEKSKNSSSNQQKMNDMFDRKRQLDLAEKEERKTDFTEPNQRKLDILNDVFNSGSSKEDKILNNRTSVETKFDSVSVKPIKQVKKVNKINGKAKPVVKPIKQVKKVVKKTQK